MKDFLGRFWAMAVSLAGLVGLYLGAVAVKLTWAFWAVVGLAVVASAVTPIRKWLTETRAVLRSHPALETEIASLRSQLASLRDELAEARESAHSQYLAGLDEGAARIVGTVLSADVAPPRILGIAERSGVVTLVGRYQGPTLARRARFTVVASGTGEAKGAVAVHEIDEPRKLVYLKCVDPISQQFWTHLEQRMAYDSTAPKEVELVRYVHTGDQLVVDEVVAAEAVEPTHSEGLE